MNQYQQELLDAVKGAGQMWITVTRSRRVIDGRATKAVETVRRQMTTMESMVAPLGQFKHTPGGYRREVCLRIIGRKKIEEDVYQDGQLQTLVDSESYLVEAL